MTPKTKKIITLSVVVLIVVAIVGSEIEKSNNKKSIQTSQNDDTNLSDTTLYKSEFDSISKVIQEVDNWMYNEQSDPMSEKMIYFAKCRSNNSINFDFPYDGGSYLDITIRKMNGVNEVILSITKGQFMSPYNSTVKMKFDDGPVKSYSFNDAADGSSDYIFLNGAKGIIQNLKKAKRIKVEPDFYQEGQTVFNFDVEGLKWDR